MDATGTGWYFSMMALRARPGRLRPARAPRRVDFLKTKYGRELLIDAASIREMPTFLGIPGPQVLTFFDILLVTRGKGRFLLDGRSHPAHPGVVLFSRPGEVREWRVSGLDGACLFFTEEFVAEALSDPFFLEGLECFAPDRPSAALALRPKERRFFLDRFRLMRREIKSLRGDAPDALRAVLYEMLVFLRRAYQDGHGQPGRGTRSSLVGRFRALVERDFARRHRIADYASELGVSPGHLGFRCRQELRMTAGAVLRRRIALEARRLLVYRDLTAAEIADRLGFADPAYFARFFRRESGEAPTAFRARRR